MKKYVVTVIDFDGKDIDIVVEGIYQNMNEAIKTILKVSNELFENAVYNGNKELSLKYKFDKYYLIEYILIYNKNGEKMFQINLNETFE